LTIAESFGRKLQVTHEISRKAANNEVASFFDWHFDYRVTNRNLTASPRDARRAERTTAFRI